MTHRPPDVPPAPEDAVHRRSIIMDSFGVGPDHVTVVGRLTDQAPWAESGQRRVHDMTLTVTVHLPDLVITAADAGMGSFPHAECPLIAPAFGRLVGLSVRKGFTRELRSRLGGVSGCAHLGELARALGPAIVRTAGERAAQTRPRDPDGAPTGAVALPLGSCHVWAADGAGPRKIDSGWRPGTVARPIPPVDKFLRAD